MKPRTPFDELSAREKAIAIACAAGIERAVTASSLSMRIRDLEAHLNNAMIKLKVANLAELVRLAVGWSVIPPLPAPLAEPPDSATPDGRALILERVSAAAAAFARAAANTGCPIFMAFAASVREFSEMCQQAERDGGNWIGASIGRDVDNNDFRLRVSLAGPRRVP